MTKNRRPTSEEKRKIDEVCFEARMDDLTAEIRYLRRQRLRTLRSMKVAYMSLRNEIKLERMKQRYGSLPCVQNDACPVDEE